MKQLICLALCASAWFPAGASALTLAHRATATNPDWAAPASREWILKTADNVCGLRDANQLTQPALLDYETCLAATPEMKKIQSQGIDPKSAEGIQLRSAAVTRVSSAAESVRSSGSYCSVWKEIRHRDGRAITDISSQVIARF